MRRAWLLARVSTDKRAQDKSNDRQLAVLREYCARQGWEVVGEGQERVSGVRPTSERPALREALEAIRGFRADVLLVTRLDRLGRSLTASLDVIAELERLRCGLVVAEMGAISWLDSLTPQGRLLIQVILAVGQFSRDDYAERSRLALERRAAAGLPLGRTKRIVVPGEAVAWAKAQRDPSMPWMLSWSKLAAAGRNRGWKFSVAAWRRALACQK